MILAPKSNAGGDQAFENYITFPMTQHSLHTARMFIVCPRVGQKLEREREREIAIGSEGQHNSDLYTPPTKDQMALMGASVDAGWKDDVWGPSTYSHTPKLSLYRSAWEFRHNPRGAEETLN